MTSPDQAANAILIVFALSIPASIFVGLWCGDRSRLGRARTKAAIRQNRRRHAWARV